MTHNYQISGMTCEGCGAKVKSLLSQVGGIKNVTVDVRTGAAVVEMERHVGTSVLQNALKDYPKYQLTEPVAHHHPAHDTTPVPGDEETKTWLQTYKPVLLIFGYILVATFLVEATGSFDPMRWMSHFMAGFFLAFSFFKLLDLKNFAESYATYDIIAGKWMGWGYVYAFTELALGLAFLTGFNPALTNTVTFAVMTVSIIGVLQSVLNKRNIRCACLGAVFNLPMSTITIIEDALMIVMSAVMLIILL
jgi:copper chaperone CopZ